MKFKKGTKVEVLTKTVVPSRSWRCGEVIYGSGPRYYIRYDGLKDTSGEAIVETVSHEAIRPCPPALEVTKDWIPGDVVEVCQNSTWAMAIVVKVLGKKYILVRLLGSSLEFKVNKFDIRVRQCWQDDKWTVIGKVHLLTFIFPSEYFFISIIFLNNLQVLFDFFTDGSDFSSNFC